MGYIGGFARMLENERWLSIAGLSNLVKLFQDIETGKLRGVEFIECWSSPLGCCGGSLTVDGSYLTRGKIIELSNRLPQRLRIDIEDAKKRYEEGSLSLQGKLLPRPLKPLDTNILKAVKKMKIRDNLLELLPKLDCGLCGCPSCAIFAEEVASGQEDKESCIFYTSQRINKLKNLYNIDLSSLNIEEEND